MASKPKRRGIRARLRLDDDAFRKEWDDRIAVVAGVFALVVILAAVVGGTLMVIKMYAGVGNFSGSSPLTEIFASRLMVAASRLAILFLGVYVVVSVIVHMRRGQWLTAAGPFRVSEAARKLFESASEQEEQVDAAEQEVTRLRTTVSDLTTQLRTAESLLQRAQTKLREGPVD
jgi:hypothetical protein